jgi:hypothetical protein
VPPFIAGTVELDGQKLGVIRIFEAHDAPIVVRDSGAVYVRDAGGKRPVADHQTLLALAQKGADARRAARHRLESLPLVAEALHPPDSPLLPRGVIPPPTGLGLLVRAAPLTVTSQFADWPIRAGPDWALRLAHHLLPSSPPHDWGDVSLQPHGRGASQSELPTLRDLRGSWFASTQAAWSAPPSSDSR